MRRWHAVVEPTVPMLLLAGVVQAVRQNVFDMLLFGGTAVLIVADSLRRPVAGVMVEGRRYDDGRAGAGRRAHAAWWAGGVVLVAIAIGGFSRDGVVMRSMLIVVALLALWIAMSRPVARMPDSQVPPGVRRGSPRGWPVWAVIGVVAGLWELTSFSFVEADPVGTGPDSVSRITHPEVTDLIDPLLTGWFGRAIFLMLWGAAGVWLLKRLAGGTRRSAAGVPGRVADRGGHDEQRPGVRHAASRAPAGGATGTSPRAESEPSRSASSGGDDRGRPS